EFVETFFEVNDQPVKGIALDLRGNPGGLQTMALEVASMFLESGKIMTYEQRNGRNVSTVTEKVIPFQDFMLAGADDDDLAKLHVMHKAPMVVLTNGSSASAAEIVTAALKDNHRATIIGTHTWGKAVAYTDSRLPNGGALRLTVSHIESPNGFNWHGKGID